MTKVVRDRGKLISERYEEDRRSFLLSFPTKYWILTIAGIIAVILPFISAPGIEGIFLISVGYTLLMVVAMIGMVMDPPPMDVVEVYENGVTVEEWTWSRRFIPYGSFTDSTLRARKKGDDLVLFHYDQRAVLRHDMPSFERFVEDVQAKVGDEDYVFEDRFMGREQEGIFQRTLFMWIVLYLLVSSVAVVVVYLSIRWILGSEPVLGILAFFVWMALMFFPSFAKWLFKGATVARYRIYKRQWLTYCVMMFLLLSIGFAGILYVAFPEGNGSDYGVLDMGDPGTSTIAPGEYTEQVINTSGPITVHDGETLRFVDCEVIFDPAEGLDSVLWIEEGGRLELVDSTISTSDLETGFRIEIRGSALISGSLIQGTCANYDEWDDDALLDRNLFPFMVLSDDVLIKDTTVADSRGSGLLLFDCKATVDNCTFLRTEESALCANWAEPTIRNCTFRACNRGMNIWNSMVTIENCTYSGLNHGIWTTYGNVTVRNCCFEQIEYNAIRAKGHNVTEENNVFSDVGTEISYSANEDLGFWFPFILFYMMPSMMLFMAWMEKKKEGRRFPGPGGPDEEERLEGLLREDD